MGYKPGTSPSAAKKLAPSQQNTKLVQKERKAPAETPDHPLSELSGNDLQPQDVSSTNFICEIVDPQSGSPCSRTFRRLRGLTSHQSSSVHRPKNKLKCTICLKEYVYLTVLENHMRCCHGQSLPVLASSDSQSSIHPSRSGASSTAEPTSTNFSQSLSTETEFVAYNEADDDSDAEFVPTDEEKESDTQFFHNVNNEEGNLDVQVSRSRTSSVIQAARAGHRGAHSSRYQESEPQLSSHGNFACNLPNPITKRPCGKTYDSPSNLKQHQDKALLHHPERAKKFKCPQCGRGYSTPYLLNRHMRDEHGYGVPRIAAFSDEDSDSSGEE